jgi:alkanesulfonate monooxygenase SsuD/methylene tetrahydromethanopterin reductase-like flavin-dependent oxidoreductase (luciferase family)
VTKARGFGVTVGLPDDVGAELARRAEATGYTSVWVNDSASGDSLATLAAYALGSQVLRLGVGVLALDRHPPDAIVSRVRELELPLERLLLGIGSGQASRPLATVGEAIAVLRDALPDAAIVVAAMGPKMCRLAGELGDAALLNWLTPPAIERSKGHMGGAGARAQAFMYVRAALDPGGRGRVGREAERYARGSPAHFDANGVPPADVGVTGRSPEDFDAALAPYEAALDEVIVRALPSSSDPEDLYALLDAARPIH